MDEVLEVCEKEDWFEICTELPPLKVGVVKALGKGSLYRMNIFVLHCPFVVNNVLLRTRQVFVWCIKMFAGDEALGCSLVRYTCVHRALV